MGDSSGQKGLGFRLTTWVSCAGLSTTYQPHNHEKNAMTPPHRVTVTVNDLTQMLNPAWNVPVKWHFPAHWLKHKMPGDRTRESEWWKTMQLPPSQHHTFGPGKGFADEVLLWPPRFHSEVQLGSAEIVLFPCLCAPRHLEVFTGGPASQTQLPENRPQSQAGQNSRQKVLWYQWARL